MTNRPVRVAVIDSGVNPTHPHVGGVAGGTAIAADGSSGDDYIDRLGHGTAVAAALRSAVGRAAVAGALVVAAGTHDGVAYLPGSLEGVVRVELEWSCPRLAVAVVSRAEGGDTVCRASGYPRPVPGVASERNLKGISFAVANVTGVLARELTGGSRPSYDDAIAALRRLQA